VVGGEQSGAGGDTNRGEIYDPVADSWTPIALPPWPIVGDASCSVLPDGRLMVGALITTESLIYDPATDSWSAAANKAVRSNEETWILLPDETILAVQCWDPYRSERYSTSSNAWKDEGKPPVMLVDPAMHEIGPAMLTYDGKVIWFGAANSHGRGKTAIYTPPPTYTGTGTWAKGPDIPPLGDRPLVCNDCPASLLPNGKVLFTAAPYQSNNWGSPIYLLEYDPFTNSIALAPTPPNNAMQLYWSRMLLLPTGHVLFGPSTNNLQCYTPDGEPQEAWRPAIWEVIPPLHRRGHGPLPTQRNPAQRVVAGEHLRRRLLPRHQLPAGPAAKQAVQPGLLLPHLRLQHPGRRDRRRPGVGPVRREPGSVRRLRAVCDRERHQLALRQLLPPPD